MRSDLVPVEVVFFTRMKNPQKNYFFYFYFFIKKSQLRFKLSGPHLQGVTYLVKYLSNGLVSHSIPEFETTSMLTVYSTQKSNKFIASKTNHSGI